MESYHNAVSDKLVVVLFENLTIYQVFKKDNLLKWKTVIHGQVIPEQLKDAIFTSSTLISCNQDFTLAPLQLEDYSNFYSLNFQDSSPIKCFDTEEFTIVSKESGSVKKVSEYLVGVQENIDINLLFAYAADKAKTDAVYFYKQADRITVLAWKDGKFALANRYPADNLDEVFYYIMLVVEQLELHPADIYFEAICTKGLHESYHALFKNYLAPLHLSSDVLTYTTSVSEEDAEAICLAHFFAQCVL
jgi:hypothetical protein